MMLASVKIISNRLDELSRLKKKKQYKKYTAKEVSSSSENLSKIYKKLPIKEKSDIKVKLKEIIHVYKNEADTIKPLLTKKSDKFLKEIEDREDDEKNTDEHKTESIKKDKPKSDESEKESENEPQPKKRIKNESKDEPQTDELKNEIEITIVE